MAAGAAEPDLGLALAGGGRDSAIPGAMAAWPPSTTWARRALARQTLTAAAAATRHCRGRSPRFGVLRPVQRNQRSDMISCTQVIELNRMAYDLLVAPKELIEGAGHLFEEPGMLDEVEGHAQRWFRYHLAGSAGV